MELSYISSLEAGAEQHDEMLWGQFELTPICNLTCKMCYVHKPEEDGRVSGAILPASFWLKQAKEAADHGMLVLSLTGGETLLYPEIDELMAGLQELGLLITFNTNGTLIDEKRVQWFLQYVPAKINISLYGASDETYEKICGIRDGFQRVSRAIDLLQAAGLNVYLNAVVVPENKDELQKMHQFAYSRKLELHTTKYIFPPRHSIEENEKREHGTSVTETAAGGGKEPAGAANVYRMEPSEAAELACMECIGLQGLDGFRKMAASACLRMEILEEKLKREAAFKKCRAGRTSFAINYKGEMQPCVLMEYIRLDLAAYTLSEAWELLKEKTGKLKTPEKCNRCEKQEICPVCKAAVIQETKGVTEAPAYLCAYADRMADILKKEGKGVAVNVLNSGDLAHSGCSE